MNASDDRAYWIAARQSGTRLSVFGPYTADDDAAHRQAWLLAYPPSVTLSDVFEAESRETAEVRQHVFSNRD